MEEFIFLKSQGYDTLGIGCRRNPQTAMNRIGLAGIVNANSVWRGDCGMKARYFTSFFFLIFLVAGCAGVQTTQEPGEKGYQPSSWPAT
jgi:hypothetical protein